MAKNNNLTDFVTDLANVIRAKENVPTTRKINPQDFSDHIAAFPTARGYKKYLTQLQTTLSATVNNPANFFDITPSLIPQEVFFDATLNKQLYPVLIVTAEWIDPVATVEMIQVKDGYTDGIIAELTVNNPIVTFPSVLFANLGSSKRCDTSTVIFQPINDPDATNEIKITTEWLTIGLPYNSDGDIPIYSLATGKGVIAP